MSVGQMTVMRFSCLMESNSLAPKAEKRLRQNMWKGWLTTQECVSKGLSNRQLAHPRFGVVEHPQDMFLLFANWQFVLCG